MTRKSTKQLLIILNVLFLNLTLMTISCGCDSGNIKTETIRKDQLYLEDMLRSISSKCKIKEINEKEIVGLPLLPKDKKPSIGIITYNCKTAGVLGLKNTVMTYKGVVDFASYEKEGCFIQYYDLDGCAKEPEKKL